MTGIKHVQTHDVCFDRNLPSVLLFIFHGNFFFRGTFFSPVFFPLELIFRGSKKIIGTARAVPTVPRPSPLGPTRNNHTKVTSAH